MYIFLKIFFSFSLLRTALAATAEEWRGRSIYQIITDRFALPEGADPTQCNPGDQTFCGGTWNTIRENLDYVQNAGFTAIWISPVSQNYEGPRTPYGDPYHGYWISDATKLNSRFGTADDLKALSTELHKRGMFLMVDVVVNNVMGLTTDLNDLSSYMFKQKSQYHPYCPIQWGNRTSEQDCWLGDLKVPLLDVNTEDPTVVSAYQDWIKNLVSEYNIDGLRIDAAKHVQTDFWPSFCSAAGVFCIGEVFGDNIDEVASFQGPDALDSTLNYPMYSALTEAFAIPGQLNTSAITDTMEIYKTKFKDPGLLGNFLENQDLPRWANMSSDPQSMYNAMVFNFMSDGIPIVYYGQEQGFNGSADPWNREPLWTSGYNNDTTAYKMIATLNKLRNFMINSTTDTDTDWLHSRAEVLTTSAHGLAIMKGDVISVLTNIGSPPQNLSTAVYTPYPNSLRMTDVLSCTQFVVGSNGTLSVGYSKGGQAKVIVPSDLLDNSDLCGHVDEVEQQSQGQLASTAFFELRRPSATASYVFLFGITFLGLLCTAVGV
ncbi:unnamed protein product [Somion occarium]|uniref:alpha-amylase n=1 Tax=Somion occarium TaxID=3059160 RepID=A0ABP1D7W7_9APHY